MLRARLFETTLGDLFREMRRRAATLEGGRRAAFEPGNEHVGLEIQGNLELSMGGEATTAAMLHLRQSDYLASTHRGHHLALAKGVDMKRLLAEIWGRKTGLSAGKGGDFHLHDTEANFETSVVMGQLIPVAVGHALAASIQGTDNIAVANFGEGAANQGTFHESCNLAALWRLPVIFLLEDNGYALSVPKQRATSIGHHAERAQSYGFPGVVVPHGSPEGVYEVMGEAVARARAGEGPTLVEVQIDRMAGGFEGDWQRYRPDDEMKLMEERDVMKVFEQRLIARGVLDADTISAMTEEFRQEFSDAVEFARASEFPDPEEAFKHLFPERSSVPQPVEVAA
jgi:pyruvate dehydrogenase E1 component alpha subunit